MKEIEHFKSSKTEQQTYMVRSIDKNEPKKYSTLNLDGHYVYNYGGKTQDVHSDHSKEKYRKIIIIVSVIILFLALIFSLFYLANRFRKEVYLSLDNYHEPIGFKNREDSIQASNQASILIKKFAKPLGCNLCINTEDRGLLIATIRKDGPADQAGLLAKDLILYLDDTSIDSAQDVKSFLENKKHDDPVRVVFMRNGEMVDLILKLDLD